MTATIPRNVRIITLLFVFAITAPISADEAISDSAAMQSQLSKARNEQMAAQKQVALKRAAAEIASKRVTDLQKQLKEFQLIAEAESKAAAAAENEQTAKATQVADLTARLKKHQHADALLVAAMNAKKQADDALKKQTELVNQLDAVRASTTAQQQRQMAATESLKTAQEQLPKTLEKLTAARTAYDTLGRDVDIAQLAVAEARNAVKAKKAAIQSETVRLQNANAALTQVSVSLKSLEESLTTLKTAARATGSNPEEAGRELAGAIAAIQPLQKRATDLVAAVQAEVDSAEKGAAQANSVLKTAQEKLREQQNKYAEQSRAHFKLQLSVADLQNADKLHQQTIADSKNQQEQLTAKQAELTQQVAAAAAETDKLQAAFIKQQQVAEAELETLGRFVSFSRHVAPIFAKRCIACHNTLTASGKLNMDSFAALMKGGESGSALQAHDSENSLLASMIEDGSMPKDADPLAKEEIALIRKWINVGAPLDAGMLATSELFEVMPEIPQPLPPKTYRVPIPVTATAFNSDAGILASSGYHEILLWSTNDGSLLRRITNVAERVYDLEFNNDGSQLIVAAGTPGELGEVKLFKTADGKHLKTLLRTKDAVFTVAFSPDGKRAAAGGADHVVSVMNISSGESELQIDDHSDWIMDVNWSPDGSLLVTASRDKTAKVFSAATGASQITFGGHGDAVYSAAFLRDGKSVVSGGSDKQARIWSTTDAKEILRIGGFGGDIFRVVVTPENHLLTASADRNAREHNLADGKLVRTFAGHKDWVYTLCYNSAKKRIGTGSYDGEIRVWNSDDGSIATSFIAVPNADAAAAVASGTE